MYLPVQRTVIVQNKLSLVEISFVFKNMILPSKIQIFKLVSILLCQIAFCDTCQIAFCDTR